MKILLYTDNHFCTNSSIIRSKGEKYSTRLENQIQSLNWVNQIAIEKGCDRMIHLGDFFDKPDLSAEELTALKEIKWNNLPKDFILGNHEIFENHNSLYALKDIGEVITEPTEWMCDSTRIVYLPYILECDRKSIKNYMYDDSKYSEYYPPRKIIILSHNDIKGIRYGQYESKQGFDIEDIYNNCDIFINGHLHNQAQINDKMINLGSLTGLNFSEDGTKYSHCIGILETTTLELELINNPYAFNFYKFDCSEMTNIEQIKNILAVVHNGVVSIKVPNTLVTEIKELLNHSDVVEYKVSTFYIKGSIDNNVIDTVHQINHIQKLKDCAIEKFGVSDILLEELELL